MSTEIALIEPAARHGSTPTRMSRLGDTLARWMGVLQHMLGRWERALRPQHTQIEIQPGEIVVNQLVPVLDLYNSKAFRLDLRSKYPLDPTVGFDEDGLDIYLLAGEDTLLADTSLDRATLIRIVPPHTSYMGEWIVTTGGGKYTLNVSMHRADSMSWLRKAWWYLTKQTPLAWDRETSAPEWAPVPTAVEIVTAEMNAAEPATEESGTGWPGTDTEVVTVPDVVEGVVVDGTEQVESK